MLAYLGIEIFVGVVVGLCLFKLRSLRFPSFNVFGQCLLDRAAAEASELVSVSGARTGDALAGGNRAGSSIMRRSSGAGRRGEWSRRHVPQGGGSFQVTACERGTRAGLRSVELLSGLAFGLAFVLPASRMRTRERAGEKSSRGGLTYSTLLNILWS
jgi:hypothetical protein